MIRPAALLLLLLGAGAAEAGTLEIETQPGVEVYWEGVHLATTDADGRLVVENVPAGPFELTLSKPGFEELSTRVGLGEGTTRLSRRLLPVAAAAPLVPAVEAPPPTMSAAGSAPPSGSSDPPAAEPAPAAGSGEPAVATAPAVRVSRGAWLAVLAVLGLGAALFLRSRRGSEAPAPPGPARSAAAPRVTRAPKSGGSFLHELRQRERALDDLQDVSAPGGRRTEVPEPDVVDVAWKEID